MGEDEYRLYLAISDAFEDKDNFNVSIDGEWIEISDDEGYYWATFLYISFTPIDIVRYVLEEMYDDVTSKYEIYEDDYEMLNGYYYLYKKLIEVAESFK